MIGLNFLSGFAKTYLQEFFANISYLRLIKGYKGLQKGL